MEFVPNDSAVGCLELYSSAEKSYEELLAEAIHLGHELDVPPHIFETTLLLLDKLKQHDEQTAKESLQTLPVALAVGEEIASYYDIPLDRVSIWSASILHDVGKLSIPKQLLDKSNLGLEWTDEDIEIMKRHPIEGSRIVREAGLPASIYRPIAEHHGKQKGSPCYGEFPELDYVERIVRDSIAIADFADACMNRTNSRNRDLSYKERLVQIKDDIEFVFNDYFGSAAIGGKVFRRITGMRVAMFPLLELKLKRVA